MPDHDLDAIERRLARVEAQVQHIADRLRVPVVEVPPRYTEPREPAPVTPSPQPPAPQITWPALDAEGFVGSRVLLAAGAFTLLLGVAFFIKYAFDNGWIGPSGRVAMGLIAGVAFVVAGQRLRTSRIPVFAHGLTGIGGGILYLALWGAGNGFHLVALPISFAAMAIVTASLLALSLRNDSEVTAAFALIGGFITPLLNASPTPQTFNLFVYLSVLDAALILLPLRRHWQVVNITAFAFTQLYFAGSFVSERGEPLGMYLAFATIFLALFMVRPVRKAIATLPLSDEELIATVAAAGVYYFTLHAELFEHHRYWLTAAVVGLAAAYVALANATRSRDRNVFASIGLALITGGVAITFTGSIVAMLWAVEGALLVWAGLARNQIAVRAFGLAGLGLACVHAVTYPPEAGPAFLNARFLSAAIIAAAFFSARIAYLRSPASLSEGERQLALVCEPLGHTSLLLGLSFEMDHLTGGNQLSLTLLWVVYAAALFTLGLLRNSSFSRWEALTVLSMAIMKAFLIDMGEVNPGVRIVSFLALGCAMLAISYAYQRLTSRAENNVA